MPKGNGDKDQLVLIAKFSSRQEHGECRKAMETTINELWKTAHQFESGTR